MKTTCRSMSDMQTVYAEQDMLKKKKKQHYNKLQYTKLVEEKTQYYQQNKAKRKEYQTEYDEKNNKKSKNT